MQNIVHKKYRTTPGVVGGGTAKDQEMMVTQLAVTSQVFLGRAGKFFAVNSPTSTPQVQC